MSKELFGEMDDEEDGCVYVSKVVVTLKALNEDIDHNLKVKNILDEIESEDGESLTLEQFKELMVILEEAGWRKQKPKKVIVHRDYFKASELTFLRMKSCFKRLKKLQSWM